VYFVLNRKKRKSLALILTFCILTGGVIYAGVKLGLVREFSLERIESTKSYEDTTLVNRFYIWQKSWKIIKDNFIIGVGIGNLPATIKRYQKSIFATAWDPHNVYISIFGETGIIGFIIFLWLIGSLFYLSFKKNNENSIFSLILLVFIAVISLKGTYHFSKNFWLSLSLAYLLAHYSESRVALRQNDPEVTK
jgi:O-antigen ligase